MTEALTQKQKFYEWSNEVFGTSPFDGKTNNLLSLVAALVLGNQGAVSYFFFAARKAGASEAELEAAVDIAAAATGLSVYSLPPKE